MARYKSIVLIFISILIVSCSGFNKLLKSKDYQLMYSKGMEYYEKKDHYRYTTLFEQLVPIYRGTQQADTIEFYLAQGYYFQGDFLLAGYYFDKFRRDYPRSVFTEEAEYMYAYCFYKSSPRPQLDQETSHQAISAFSEFIAKYPKSSKKAEVNAIMVELKEKLVEKSFISAKLYYDMSEYRAAITALKNSLNTFPDSKYREDQLYMILDSSYKLADNSIPSRRRERFQNTIDEYYNLISEFPETKYLKEAERMYNNSVKTVENK
jgi:outer membrane protein assembly factor BamD